MSVARDVALPISSLWARRVLNRVFRSHRPKALADPAGKDQALDFGLRCSLDGVESLINRSC